MNLFQAVEQDRHILKRKLANLEGEHETRVLELQNDIAELQEKLNQKEAQAKQFEREKSSLVAELTQQNSRLSAQLKQAQEVEQQLVAQVERLRGECAQGKASLHEHVASVDSLRDEVNLLGEKNQELERRLTAATAERDSLTSALEEATDRIMGLERHAREQEMRLQHSIREYHLPSERLSVEEKLASKYFPFNTNKFQVPYFASILLSKRNKRVPKYGSW